MTLAISIHDIEKAAERLAGKAVITPLIESPALNEKLGGRILLKCETFQRCGAFKFRGAYNRLSALSADERKKGVVALSTGNHAQGVALAAKLLGMKATIVMPADAPKLKLDNTRAYGADIVTYDKNKDDRDEVSKRVLAERGGTFVHPYNDVYVMAGQGTAGLELVQQAETHLDAVVIGCGGGGLAAGVTTAVRYFHPRAKITIVEPEGYDETVRSLETGNVEKNIPGATTICDAIVTPWPGPLTLPILRHHKAHGVVVNDEEVKSAMRYAFNWLKLVVEPGGCVALAAALAGKLQLKGKTTVLMLTGANVDPAFFADVIKG